MSSAGVLDRSAVNPPANNRSRTSWGIADQAIWSVGNLVLVLLVARSTSGAAFGTFSAVYGLTLAGVGLAGGLTHESTLLSEPDRRRQLRPAAFGLAVILGIILAVVLLAFSLVLGEVGPALVGFAVAVVPVALVETARGHLNLEGRTRLLFLVDLLWTLLSISAIAVLAQSDASVGSMAAAWGLASVPSSIIAFRAMACRPSLGGVRAFLDDRGPTGLSFSSEYLVSSGLAQLLSPLVAAIAGLQAAGVLRLLQVAFGPFTSLTSGLRMVVTPQLRDRHTAQQPLRPIVMGMSAALGTAGTALGVALWLLPTTTGIEIAGELWPEVQSLMTIAIPHRVLIAFALGAAMAARALGLVKASRNVRFIMAALTVMAASAGSAVDGARGVLIGLTAAQAVGLVLWILVLRSDQNEPAGATS